MHKFTSFRFNNENLHSQEQFWIDGVALVLVTTIGIFCNIFTISRLFSRHISREEHWNSSEYFLWLKRKCTLRKIHFEYVNTVTWRKIATSTIGLMISYKIVNNTWTQPVSSSQPRSKKLHSGRVKKNCGKFHIWVGGWFRSGTKSTKKTCL